MREAWKKYLDGLSEADARKMLEVAIGSLFEFEEVGHDIPEENDDFKECIYWRESGDSLLED